MNPLNEATEWPHFATCPANCPGHPKSPDLTSKPHAVIDVEKLRDFVVQRSVTIMEESGRAVDAVPLSDLVDWYEQLTNRDFYKNRGTPNVGPDTTHPHTFTSEHMTLKRLVAEREFHRANGEEVDPQ